jgi:hypothetical protein
MVVCSNGCQTSGTSVSSTTITTTITKLVLLLCILINTACTVVSMCVNSVLAEC